jgi:hypothetical protein
MVLESMTLDRVSEMGNLFMYHDVVVNESAAQLQMDWAEDI